MDQEWTTNEYEAYKKQLLPLVLYHAFQAVCTGPTRDGFIEYAQKSLSENGPKKNIRV